MKNIAQFLVWPIVCGLLLALLILQINPLQTAAPSDQTKPAHTSSYAPAVDKTAPAVVNIYTSKLIRQRIHPLFNDPIFRHFFDRSNIPQQERIQRSLGSGVIVSKDGYILTNHHVIKDADQILVALFDGRETLADVEGVDADTDLAVLKIDLPQLNTAPVGDTSTLRVGDIVLAIGNPFGFEQTVTQGIISATGRHGLNINTYENFIQTDAAINPGNSGGALIDAAGNLIGINSAILSKSGGSQGIGLAIPIDIAEKVMLDIVRYGRVIRGWLGIEGRDLRRYSAQTGTTTTNGILISGTHPRGPAAKAGILPGDLMTAINGTATTQAYRVMQQVANMPPGQKIRISLIRDDQEIEVFAEIRERP